MHRWNPSRIKTMNLALNLSLTLLVFFTFIDKSLSITNYQINQICRKEKSESICINNLLEKKSKLQKGNPIEIPVKPYKR